MNRSTRMHLLALVSLSVAGAPLAGCNDGPLLADRDGGADAPALADAGSDAGRGDAGPPPIDGGPACTQLDPTPPTDPTAGRWEERFGNPGVGGDLPNVEAFAFGADGLVYVGGDFTSAGYAPASNVAAWDGALGWRALGAGLPGRVAALAMSPAGVLFAAHAIDPDYDATRISRWNGTAWAEVAESTGAIHHLEATGTMLYAVGDFTRIGGVDTYSVAFYDGTAWAGFSRLRPDGSVYAVSATSPSDVCIGGSFTTLGDFGAGPVASRHAACWDGTAWQPRAIPVEFYVGIYTLERDPADGSLVAGGNFMLDDLGTNGGSLARWVTDHWELIGGGVMSEFGPGTTKEVRGIAFAGGATFVGGGFNVVDVADPRTAHAVARWDGTAWDDLGGLFAEVGFSIGQNNVYSVAAGPDGSVYFGGLFTRADSQRVAHVVRWDGTYWSTLRTPGERYEGVAGSVFALARQGTCATYVGGAFEYAGDVRANNIARFTEAGGYEALGEGVAGGVTDIAVSRSGLVYAAGDFVDGGEGSAFRNIAAWDGARWRGLGDGLDGVVWGVAVDEPSDGDRLVYAAGTMGMSGSTPITRFGRWDGTAWTDLGAGIAGFPFEFDPTMESDPYLYDVIVDPETHDVIVAGSFRAIGEGAARVVTSNVARWDGTSWHAYGGGLGGLSGSVLTITLWNGDLVAGGSFEIDGTRTRVARWDGTAWRGVGGAGLDAINIAALEPSGDALFAGGVFSIGTVSTHVAVFDGTEWSPLGNSVSDVVEALVSTEEGLYVGGTFDRAGVGASVGLGLWHYED